MDADRFDTLVKTFGARSSRRRVLTGALGLAGGVLGGTLAMDGTSAARRGFAGPGRGMLPVPSCEGVGDSCGGLLECCSGCCVSAGGAPPVCVEQTICL
jgi:hypothetical protein